MAKSLPAPPARPVSLAHLSLIEAPPDRLIRIAAEAGFDFRGLAAFAGHAHRPPLHAAGTHPTMPRAASRPARHWNRGVGRKIIRPDDQTQPQDHLPLMEAVAILGARRIKLVCDSLDHGRRRPAGAGSARLAQPLGLTLDLEYMIFSGVRSFQAASRTVTSAGAPNLKVLVDALHWMRAGDTVADLRADPARLGYVQLCDGPVAAPQTREALIREARTDRLAPGEGEFPLQALLAAMPQGCVASVEVPMPPGRAPRDHARTLLEAARRLTHGHDMVRP